MAERSKGQFVKGQSGNPTGRPKADLELRDLARTHTEEALQALLKILRAKQAPAMAKVHAANSILDRGYGRPAQQVDLTNSDGSLADMFRAAVMAANGIIEEADDHTGATGATH